MNQDRLRASSPPLEPDTPGEDLEGNFRDIVGIAKQHCLDCADYHIGFVAGRVANRAMGITVDREPIMAILGRLFARKANGGDAIDLVIAGSADSGVLATCAGAAFLAGPEIAGRVRFTVLDRCGTPLELCRRYAARHSLDLSTRVADLLEPGVLPAADIVVIHSLLRFVAHRRQGDLLALISGSLKPGATLVLSHGMRSAGEPRRRPQTAATLIRMIDEGQIDPPEPRDVFLARLRRRVAAEGVATAEYGSREELLDLFASSPLAVSNVDEVGRDVTIGDEVSRRRRVIVVARNRTA